jgi:hypothetical protein
MAFEGQYSRARKQTSPAASSPHHERKSQQAQVFEAGVNASREAVLWFHTFNRKQRMRESPSLIPRRKPNVRHNPLPDFKFSWDCPTTTQSKLFSSLERKNI